MKRIVFLIIIIAATLRLSADETRFAVLSDPHVLSQALLNDSAQATRSLVNEEPKLVEKSQELFDSAVARIVALQPDFLLIPGDLTYNGEELSHKHVAEQLHLLQSAGIATYVIPGNHDVNNPGAASYSTEKRQKTDNVNTEAFAAIYEDFGYSSAVMRQSNGLSYLAYPCPDWALLCLDSTTPNDSLHTYSAGGLTEATLSWAEEAASKAKSEGRSVLCMMHHQLMEHFDNEATAAPNYIANLEEGMPPLEEVQNRLSAAGVEVVFTGHFHIHSIQHVFTETGQLTDVSTGALCSYASPIRLCTIDDDRQLNISTEHLSLYDTLAQSRNKIIVNAVIRKGAAAMYPMMESYASQLPSYVAMMVKLPQSETQMYDDLKSYLGDVALDIYNTLAHGDEELLDPASKMKAFHDAMDAYMLSVCKGNSLILGLLKAAMADEFDALMGEADAMLESILYNYVGTADNYVPDGTYSRLLSMPEKESIHAIAIDKDKYNSLDYMGRKNNSSHSPRIVNGRKIIYK